MAIGRRVRDTPAYGRIIFWSTEPTRGGGGPLTRYVTAGTERLQTIAGRVPRHIVLLQADLFDLPFAADRFGAVFSLGMLHLFGTPDPVLESFHRVLKQNGSVFISSLVVTGRFGDRYLRFLHRAGEVAGPRQPSEFEAAVKGWFEDVESIRIQGNMAFIRAVRRFNEGQKAAG